MTNEERQLLLKDICARLPYGVILANGAKARSIDILTKIVSGIGTDKKIKDTKYYLRPMSDMTEEELKKFYIIEGVGNPVKWNKPQPDWYFSVEGFDWLNAHHFDYRGLIEKGLALEAPENMYNLKEK